MISRREMECLILILLLIPPSVGRSAFNQGNDKPTMPLSAAERDVLQVEEERIQALLRGDTVALEYILAEEFISTESSGKVSTKPEFIAAFKRDGVGFESFEIEENNVRIYGETAIVIGRYVNRMRARDATPAPLKRARHLRFYVKRSGRWLLVAHQATEIAKYSISKK